MKKRVVAFIIILVLLVGCFIGFMQYNKSNDKNKLTKIRVAEVTHSLFYAPLYAAIENGYFEENGLEVELILTPGADKVSAAVLSGDVEIGFCGPESSIYVYNGGEKDYIKSFAGLTKRDGQFIVSREKIDDFTLEDLKGKEVLAGRAAGMPELNFETALNNSNINIEDVDINTSVEFAALSGSFIGGVGDFVNLFEPNATKLESEGYGYIVASVGLLSDEVPYTAFNAQKSYIQDNKDIIEWFTNAINKGLEYVSENDAETIAKAVIDQFPDTSMQDAITIVQRYKEYDSWLSSPFISEESFINLENIMLKADLIEDYVPYADLVENFYEE